MLKFWPTTITFFLGLIAFFYFHSSLDLTYWLLMVWIVLFLVIQFCGAYFIGLNFHLPSINSLDTNSKTVMLTFDDGPHNLNTARVLQVLRKHEVRAVFFVIGKNIQGNEWLLEQMLNEGHEIGNHSFSHDTWIDLWSAKKVGGDIMECQTLIEMIQPETKLFRPPYGVTNPNIAKVVRRFGLQSVGWNIRSYDTSIKDFGKIQQRILSKLKPGAIILLHDRLDFMPELLDELIPEIKSKGYSFTSSAF